MSKLVLPATFAAAFASGAAAQTGTLTGYVRDEASLRGIPGVDVTIEGIDRRARTDKDGRYTVRDVPAGARVVHVRLVGFAPIDTLLDFKAGETTEDVFFLAKPPVRLDSVVTTGRLRTPGAGYASFAERKERGFGVFLDSTFLRANESRHLPDVLRGLRGIEIVTPSTCKLVRPVLCNWRVASSHKVSNAFCAFQVLLDGVVVQRSIMIDDRDAPAGAPPQVIQAYADNKEAAWSRTYDLNNISVSSLIGVEVYRSGAEAPDVFGGSGTSCGVLVLWTHH